MTIHYETLYELCNEHQWCTSASVKQYDRLFEKNRNNASIRDLALLIWILSNNVEEDKIYNILHNEWEKERVR